MTKWHVLAYLEIEAESIAAAYNAAEAEVTWFNEQNADMVNTGDLDGIPLATWVLEGPRAVIDADKLPLPGQEPLPLEGM